MSLSFSLSEKLKTASTCSLRSGLRAASGQSSLHFKSSALCALVSLTRSSFVCCALNKFTSTCEEQLKFRQNNKTIINKVKPLQGAATMTEYVQVINPHHTTRSTAPISRGHV